MSVTHTVLFQFKATASPEDVKAVGLEASNIKSHTNKLPGVLALPIAEECLPSPNP
jgi:hypothetical protein